MHIYIFISYGHDKYADRTRMLYEQLCKSDENFAIWWDNKLEVSDDWIIEIERSKTIQTPVSFMLSPHILPILFVIISVLRR